MYGRRRLLLARHGARRRGVGPVVAQLGQPTLSDGYGQSCQPGGVASTILFQHGAPWWLAAYQRIQAPQLLSDVRGFFDGSLTNGGWVIKEACAETYKKACGSGTPGFQMASSRAANADQRPRLTLWFRWS